jgi:hypothetical protein
MQSASELPRSMASPSRERAFTGVDVANVIAHSGAKRSMNLPPASGSPIRHASETVIPATEIENSDNEIPAPVLSPNINPTTVEVDPAMLPRVVALSICSHMLSQSNPQFVLYVVDVTTTRLQWKIKRRYSQFRNLHERLLEKGYSCPSFPGRAFFNM